MIQIETITKIYKSSDSLKGYYIEFEDGNKIHITKKRTIIALLILIKYGIGSEADLAQGSLKIPEIKKNLEGRIPEDLIQDYYGDANKPFSELWNEEGFTFIDNLKGGRAGKSQAYTLKVSDHPNLFKVVKKANRKPPSATQMVSLLKLQKNQCNLCGSKLLTKKELKETTYAKDRRRIVFDHRLPVEKGGDSNLENYQALCFYCNKCKWQICNICTIPGCDPTCTLRQPEISFIIAPTGEDISDVLKERDRYKDLVVEKIIHKISGD